MHDIVFLDRDTIGPNVALKRPQTPHNWRAHKATAPGDIISRLQGADVAITNKVPMTAQTIAALPDLKLIAVSATGYNVVDVEAARARGVAVCNVRGYAATTVPETSRPGRSLAPLGGG